MNQKQKKKCTDLKRFMDQGRRLRIGEKQQEVWAKLFFFKTNFSAAAPWVPLHIGAWNHYHHAMNKMTNETRGKNEQRVWTFYIFSWKRVLSSRRQQLGSTHRWSNYAVNASFYAINTGDRIAPLLFSWAITYTSFFNPFVYIY